MLRMLFGVALSSLIAVTASAQIRDPCHNFPCPALQSCTAPADAPSCVADPVSACPVVTVYTHGKMDAFAPPDDPTTPSAALTAFLGATRSQYDTPGCNRHFGDSFPVSCLRCQFCDAKVEIHLKPCAADSGPTNDDYVIGVAPFTAAGTIASGRIWPPGVTPSEKILVVTLPAAKLNALLCKAPRPGTLDVYVEDDTIVDWVRVTLYSQ